MWSGGGTLSASCSAVWGSDSWGYMAIFGVRISTKGESWTIDSGGRINLANGYSYGFQGIATIIGVA